ncbi:MULTISPECIES: ASCH domain-containing protein [Deefgea]|uniref:ASCH domain-containing protein n=1 Tax=Deefgea chitinilytica TaxID=570276 RepID=A0ABS2CCR3_9NEIS|nr:MULTISPECIES: ASCH domain-containing protein [Deefgea]MBM5571939.1 ASCH domain-containing protein [Deefgea chitinilytica]MBM9889174.1 ASCH domain-containing protein [Deefgea sp. CFH1-16]
MQPIQLAFWQQVLAKYDRDPASQCHEIFYFDDNQADADALADMVLSGQKQATAGLQWLNEYEGLATPTAGDLSLLTRFDGTPVAIIETREVIVCPFIAVSAEFAAAEGEGDLSLAHWRKVHWDFFTRACASIKRQPTLQMPIVCEYFNAMT